MDCGLLYLLKWRFLGIPARRAAVYATLRALRAVTSYQGEFRFGCLVTRIDGRRREGEILVGAGLRYVIIAVLSLSPPAMDFANTNLPSLRTLTHQVP